MSIITIVGAGDLYVIVFGVRNHKAGILLGRGLSFEDAMRELRGVILESVMIATRTARAVRKLIMLGKEKASEFPLLLHIDDVINNGAPVNIPWNDFESDYLLTP